MKKFYPYFGLLLLLSGVALTSCLSKPKDPYKEVNDGFTLVSMIQPQNLAAMDPLNIAFRLNTLLATLERQRAENPGKDITIENIDVPNKDGVTPLTKNLKKMLFGDAEIKEHNALPGAWIITYKLNSMGVGAGESDNKRRGDVMIDTGGKLLKDMGDDDVWSITTGSGLEAYQLIDALGLPMFCEIRACQIGKSADRSWNAMVMSRAFMGDDPDLSKGWEANYTITQSGGGGEQDYENTIISTYIFDEIIGNGYLAVYNVAATYSAKDLTYTPKCNNLSTPYAGSESIVVELDNLIAPLNRVRISYGGSAGNCSKFYLLTYNGYIYDSRSGGVTGGDS